MTTPGPTHTDRPITSASPPPPVGPATTGGPTTPRGPAPAGGPDDRRPPGARPIGWGLALIGAGVVWLLALAGVSIPWELVLPVALLVIGVLLLAGGRWMAHSGLIGLGVVLAVFALVSPVAPGPASVSAGDRTHTVTDVSDLESDYRLGAGTLTIDLTDLDLPPGTTALTASVGMGELVVRVPPDVTVEGEARVGMGDVVAFDASRGGIAPTLDLRRPGASADDVLELELRVGLGSIEVVR